MAFSGRQVSGNRFRKSRPEHFQQPARSRWGFPHRPPSSADFSHMHPGPSGTGRMARIAARPSPEPRSVSDEDGFNPEVIALDFSGYACETCVGLVRTFKRRDTVVKRCCPSMIRYLLTPTGTLRAGTETIAPMKWEVLPSPSYWTSMSSHSVCQCVLLHE